jgi:phenylpyruvate tautomerase PptA (4-oxalocrotonate tautomerase family)
MPLVRISVIRAKPAAPLPELGEAVHRALVDTIGVPAQDRFQILSAHAEGHLVYDPEYLDIARGDGIVIVQITLSAGRSLERKRALYQRIAGNLAELGVRREDVMINLVEVASENWSFGNGSASYAP